MNYGLISSLHLAVVVLEILKEVFEDVVIDHSFYQIAVLSKPVYNAIFDATTNVPGS